MGVVWSMFKAAARAAAEYGAGEDAPSAAADGAEVRRQISRVRMDCRTNSVQLHVHAMLP